MHEHRGQSLGADLFRLPMTVTEHATSVERVHFDLFFNVFKIQSGPRQKIPNNCLSVSVREPAPGHERGKPIGPLQSGIIDGFNCAGVRTHLGSIAEEVRKLRHMHGQGKDSMASLWLGFSNRRGRARYRISRSGFRGYLVWNRLAGTHNSDEMVD